MIHQYTFHNSVPQPIQPGQQAEITILVKPTQNEIERLCRMIDINPVSFDLRQSACEVSRFHPLDSQIMTNPAILVIYDFIHESTNIENQLLPVIIIFDEQQVIISTETLETAQTLLHQHNLNNPLEFLVQLMITYQNHLMTALSHYQKEIDELDHAAKTSMNTEHLRHLTDLTRAIVYFEHTMNDQDETIRLFLASNMTQQLSNDLTSCLKIQQRRLNKTIHIYRDLLTSISGLFTAMMDSNLNNLMKFLDSAGIVLAVAALVTGFMGMNVGGLPLKANHVGFWLTLLVAAIACFVVGLFLKRKQYNK